MHGRAQAAPTNKQSWEAAKAIQTDKRPGFWQGYRTRLSGLDRKESRDNSSGYGSQTHFLH
jgi:hypothetical protein